MNGVLEPPDPSTYWDSADRLEVDQVGHSTLSLVFELQVGDVCSLSLCSMGDTIFGIEDLKQILAFS